MQTGLDVLKIFAKALHDGDRIARNCVVGSVCADCCQCDERKHDGAARTAAFHDFLESSLPLPEYLLEFSAWIAATIRRTAPLAVTVLPGH